jgi:Xaa-Pro aminopeptidase
MTQSYFTSEFFTSNRERLKALFTGTAPIVITANGLLQRRGDSSYNFAQDANFWYLTGIDEPDLVLVMDRDREYLIVPRRSASREAFDGAVAAEELSRRSGITEVFDDLTGWEQLINRTKKVRYVATVVAPPSYIESYGLYTNPSRAMLRERLLSYNPELELLDLGPHLMRMRMVKQPSELQAIQQAIDITVASLQDTLRPAKLRKMAYEYEVEAEICYGFRKRGAAGHAFDPIVASGQRACVLHNVANSGHLSADELLLMDVGAEVDHYAADITRTKSLGQPTSRQLAVHKAVLETQRFAFEQLKPGVLIKDYEEQVEQFLGEKLRELNLLKSITHDAVRSYCPHAISHFLGLTVHDIGDYERPLEPGVVLTVEPGIYIPDEAIGVRIEDDVVITDSGIEILSDKLSRDLA